MHNQRRRLAFLVNRRRLGRTVLEQQASAECTADTKVAVPHAHVPGINAGDVPLHGDATGSRPLDGKPHVGDVNLASASGRADLDHDLPRWNLVDWGLVRKDPEDLEQIAYELIHANFSTSYADSYKVLKPSYSLDDTISLSTQLVFIINAGKEALGVSLGDVAMKLYQTAKKAMQAVSDAHRKAIAPQLKAALMELFPVQGAQVYRVYHECGKESRAHPSAD